MPTGRNGDSPKPGYNFSIAQVQSKFYTNLAKICRNFGINIAIYMLLENKNLQKKNIRVVYFMAKSTVSIICWNILVLGLLLGSVDPKHVCSSWKTTERRYIKYEKLALADYEQLAMQFWKPKNCNIGCQEVLNTKHWFTCRAIQKEETDIKCKQYFWLFCKYVD